MASAGTRTWLAGLASVLIAGGWAIVRSPMTESFAASDVLRVAEHFPTRPGEWQLSFYVDSPPLLQLVQVLGIHDSLGVVRLGFVLSLLAITGMAVWTLVVTGGVHRWRVARLALLGPVTAVLFAGLGFYDALTVVAWGAVLSAWAWGGRWVLAMSGLLLGAQHATQGLFGLVALWLTWLALRDRLPGRLGAANPLWAGIGILAGQASVALFLFVSGQQPFVRGEWLAEFLPQWTRVALTTAPFLVWSLFAGLWPALILAWQRTHDRRWLLLGALVPPLAATAITGDRPRVFVLVALPSVLVALVATFGQRRAVEPVDRMVEAVAWIAPPVLLFGTAIVNVDVWGTGYPAVLRLTGLG